MTKEKRSFWDMLFGLYPSEREEEVLESFRTRSPSRWSRGWPQW